ncbi:MAG: hypothetical protein QJR02_11450 [Sinobacteraceae bacterium]|nr:hypothetical protein [Nevskiaceae bacterium]
MKPKWKPHTEAPTEPISALIAVPADTREWVLLNGIYIWSPSRPHWVSERNGESLQAGVFLWLPDDAVIDEIGMAPAEAALA